MMVETLIGIIVLSLGSVQAQSLAPQSCPSNQVWVDCVPCAWSCSNKHLLPVCTKVCPDPGCACPSGTFWNGQLCVPSNSCPTNPGNPALQLCPSNQVWVNCVPCAWSCSNRDLLLVCRKACPDPGCACPSGTLWNGKHCVPPNSCPSNPGNPVPPPCPPGVKPVNCLVAPCQVTTCPKHPKATCVDNYCCGCDADFYLRGRKLTKEECNCPGNQIYYDGVQTCKPCIPTISQPGGLPICPAVCLAGCGCPRGLAWSDVSKTCVKSSLLSQQCPKGQIYHRNKPCGRDCKYLDRPVACLAAIIPGCGCPDGYYWSDVLEECVRRNQCPRACPGRQVFQKCQPFPLTCSDLRGKQPFCPRPCRPGCACHPGYLYNKLARDCIPRNSCPSACPSNQVYYRCTPCQQTCKTIGSPIKCPRNRICRPGCACRSGLVWDGDAQRCVTSNRCPKTCPSNKVFHQCEPCERTCENPRPICTLACRRPGCGCPSGLVWNARLRRCIRESECPKACPSNKVFYQCGPCERTCENPRPICTLACRRPGCGCPSGLVWNARLRRCIRESECPKACPSNKVFHQCGPCERTCENPRPICTLACREPGCGCPSGLVWSSKLRRCVRESECPKDCPGNQIYFPGCKPCLHTCDQVGSLLACPEICQSGCSCKEKTFWNPRAMRCLEADACPVKCPNNQVYSTCVQCVPKCPGPLGALTLCPLEIPCKAKCTCEAGLFLNRQGICVKRSQCPLLRG